MLWRRIDTETGMFIEDVILDVPPLLEDGTPDPAYIETPVPPDAGFYHPRWDFDAGEWVEGLTPEEIAARQNQPVELSEVEKLKIRQDAAENAILFLMDMNMGGML